MGRIGKNEDMEIEIFRRIASFRFGGRKKGKKFEFN